MEDYHFEFRSHMLHCFICSLHSRSHLSTRVVLFGRFHIFWWKHISFWWSLTWRETLILIITRRHHLLLLFCLFCNCSRSHIIHLFLTWVCWELVICRLLWAWTTMNTTFTHLDIRFLTRSIWLLWCLRVANNPLIIRCDCLFLLLFGTPSTHSFLNFEFIKRSN